MAGQPLWREFAHAFEWDGALLDLYVLDTSEKDWANLLGSLPLWEYQVSFLPAEMDGSIPGSFEDAHAGRGGIRSLLQIGVGDLCVNCHFFTPSEIELDIDPRQVTSQTQLDGLCEFMRRLGTCVGRSVLLCPENRSDIPILTFDPAADLWVWHPA